MTRILHRLQYVEQLKFINMKLFKEENERQKKEIMALRSELETLKVKTLKIKSQDYKI